MSYALFLVLFVVLPALAGFGWRWRDSTPWVGTRPLRAIALTALIAFLWTVPWDNYLVYRGVWGYGPERVIGVIGYVPVEEYLFFLLQPVFVGAFVVPAVSARASPRPETPWGASVRRAGAGVMALLGGVGGWLLLAGPTRGLYLGLILAWAMPVLAGLWYYAAPHFWRLRGRLGPTLGGLTLWLWLADAFAIHDGIWTIAPAYSLGLGVAGLPIEEMTFFLVTTLLCGLSIVLFLHGDRIPPPFRRG